jgi:glycine/D-amino acid oxidase-like deaminating enzyme
MAERLATRIVVVGAGNVGATFAYALLLSGLATEIVLIDANRERAEGEAMDLAHAVPFSPHAHLGGRLRRLRRRRRHRPGGGRGPAPG